MTETEGVDWTRLIHAYGPATDTPAHLEALTSLDPEAFDHLWGAILHQGTIYPATAPVVQWVLDHLEAPELDGTVTQLLTGTENDARTELLQFLASVGESASWMSEDELRTASAGPVDPADLATLTSGDAGEVPDEVWSVVLARGVLAVRGLAPAVVAAVRPWLDDADPRRKAAARAALTRWSVLTDPDETADLHRATARSEAELAERVGAVLALGSLDHDTTDFLDDEEPAVRTAAALGAAATADPRVADVLLDHLEGLPWTDEDLREGGEDFFEGHPRFRVVEALVEAQAGRELPAERLVAAGLSLADLSSAYVFDRDLAPLLGVVLSGWSGGPLAPAQATLVRAVADSEGVWAAAIENRTFALGRLGLPTDRAALAALVADSGA